MSAVPLGELIVPARVARAGKDDHHPLLSMTMHDGLVDQASKFKKRVASEDVSDYKVVQRGQLVVGFPIDEGVLDFQQLYPTGIVSPAYGVWDLIAEDRIDRGYMKRFLRSPRAMGYYRSKLRGSTARRRSLPADVFLALPVLVPPLDEQRRIAAILDRADALRTQRRKAIALIDDLTQSVFLDMFGDPDQASETVRFDEIAGLSGGRNLVADDPNAPSQFRVLKISAVTTGQFTPQESKPLPPGYVPPEGHLVRTGDLLMSRANTAALVGAVAHVRCTPSNLVLPDKIWRFEWRDSESDPVFYHALFHTPAIRRRISQMASGTGGSMKNISKAKLQSLRLPRVEAGLQSEFAGRVKHVNAQRELAQRSLAALDELFASLQSRAFSGGLAALRA